MVAERFGPYRLNELIGQGGMGEVYRAYDTVKERTVALKRLPTPLASDAEFQARFRRESKIVAGLREPHIIPIHDFGKIDGQLYIDMRLVEGSDLGAVIAQSGPLPATRAVNIVAQVASALGAAHSEELVHRDVKPSNVLISDREDFVYLVDFGIARTSTATSMTATGATVGTLDYMAPERLLKGRCDHRADIYALGCVLYESLTGTKPFAGDGLEVQMYAHVHAPPPRPSDHRPNLPTGLDHVVAQAMAKDPDQRYHTATEFADAARAALTTPSPITTTINPASSEATTHAPDGANEHAAAETVIPHSSSSPSTPTGLLLSHRRRPKFIAIAAVAATLVLVSAGIALLDTGSPTTTPMPVPTRITPTPKPTVTATILVGASPGDAAVAPDGRRAFITTAANAVSVIDTSRNAVTATIPVGENPVGVAFAPDGARVYAANFRSNSVSVIDTSRNAVTATIPVGPYPSGVAVAPDGGHAYVSDEGSGSVSVIDTATNAVTATIHVDNAPERVAVAPDSTRAYVSNLGSDSVSVLDTATNAVTATIHVGNGPSSVAVGPDGRRLYTSNESSINVSVIDTTTNTVTATIPLQSAPLRVAVAPDGAHAWVAGFGTVSVIDTATNTVTATIPVGKDAESVAFAPDGRHVYVPGFSSNSVAVIDTGAG